MSTPERAIAIAAHAHRGVLDKGGEPYILHPLRVMLAVDALEQRIAAALHDVVEDSDWTLTRLREEGFSQAVVEAVDALTRREGEDYLDYVRRAGANPIARRVKLADLSDNRNLTRIAWPTPTRSRTHSPVRGCLGASSRNGRAGRMKRHVILRAVRDTSGTRSLAASLTSAGEEA